MEPGPHLLEAELYGGRVVRVLAEPAGTPERDGQPLLLRVVDRGQMAELLSLIEQLDHKRPIQSPPKAPGSLESRIPIIEDAPTGAAFLPESGIPSSVDVEVDCEVDDDQGDHEDDDAPTLMQTPTVAKVGLVGPPEVPAKPYVPALSLNVPHDPISFADTLMPPSSFVERTLLLPLGQNPAPRNASPQARPPAAAPIPREEPQARTEARTDGPTEPPRRPPPKPNEARVMDGRAEPSTSAEQAGLPPAAPVPGVPAKAPGPLSPSSSTPVGARPIPAEPSPSTGPGAPNGTRLLGRTIAGKYTIDSSIGRGATAEVFRAQHASLKRPVAVKILHQENAGYLQFVKRFKAEAHTLSKLEHQNIARVIDFGQEPDGLLYLVMELLVGKSLEVLLSESSKKLPVRKVLDVGIQTCNALAFAHDEGVIHRDVKPENVVLVPHRDEDGKPCDLVKVCDFGLAKLRDPDPENTDITMGGTLCGSPAYMSPEQILGEKLDARTDLYALSTMLFESLTGELPHDAIGLTQLFAKKLLEAPTPIRKLLPDIDPGLEAAIMRGLSRERAARQDDARVLRQELRAVLSRMKD